jgi:hypothetical protein
VTDAADGGIADRGGGRGSYRVIDFNAGQILQRAHSTLGFARAGASALNHQQKSAPVHLTRCPYAREGERRQ